MYTTDNKLRLQRKTQLRGEGHIFVGHRSVLSFPLHTHDYFEIEIITSGQGKQNINGRECDIYRGCVTLLTPADFHSVEIPCDGFLTLWNIPLDETLLTESLSQLFFRNSGSCTTLPDNVLEKVLCAAELLEKEVADNGYARPLTDYIMSLITSETSAESTQYSPIREAIMYIDTHFRESPTLAESAKRACLSTVYFGNLFKKVTGETYINYLNTRKVDCAAMLLESGMSVTEACFSSGFGSLSGFLHTFRKYMGTSPESYKKSKENKNVHNK